MVCRTISLWLVTSVLAFVVSCNDNNESRSSEEINSQPAEETYANEPSEEDTISEPDYSDVDQDHLIRFDHDSVLGHIRQALDDEGHVKVIGSTPEEILEQFGEPIAMIRQGKSGTEGSKEAWVYHVYPQDSTGLYIFFQDGKSVEHRLDSFNGVYGSHLERWFRP